MLLKTFGLPVRKCGIVCFIASLVFTLLLPDECSTTPQGESIERWANRLGKELWDLGEAITKNSEIEYRYAFLNAQVERKDPKSILTEIVEDISRMMDRKMDAIKCIVNVAEVAAEEFELNETDRNYTYYSSKYSPIQGEEKQELPEALEDNEDMYLAMALNNDTHFYNLKVNTSYSSVHVPTNVFDRHDEAEEAIRWSEVLDNVFVQNYNSDPALSWQYFGSSSGIMRHYPAMNWGIDKDQDLFDCRIRTWFIEAATCTKDVVILLDDSGSMTGMHKHIASLTIYSILDTFSNNDYVNIMNYSEGVTYTVPCFAGQLVQATEENIIVFKNAVQALVPDGKSRVDEGLVAAFNLLSTYRELRGCTEEEGSSCNQAIMLITDGLQKNMSDILYEYNWLHNGSSIPVRVFTFLVGKEVTKVEEIMWMACTNRGYYTPVQSLEQVTESVYKYISVIARPLVLQSTDHPVSWTHAYYDLTYDFGKKDMQFQKYRLLTSVAIPAYDRKVNRNNATREAKLLGVAGTDVPLDDMQKLMFPYKTGVNAHAFIVTNNGYVIMHPDLRPMDGRILKDNYNSIDLTEVEQMHDGLGPRELGDTLLELRSSLVHGLEGVLHDVEIKYHYDDMRRASIEVNDYYFAPIANTPFTVAIAFPDLYGNYSIEVGDEIQKDRHTGIEITSFFQGSNWKIHPKWVYCKYHYLEGHEFDTPEKELLHFLGRMYDREFKWSRQYEAEVKHKHPNYDIDIEDLEETECGRKTHGDDDYYCDRELVQRLVFDAKNTMSTFAEPWIFRNDREQFLFKRYNATMRFIATMSGLTRWEYIFGEDENSTSTEFGDLHSRAIDETWYKSAVIQHRYDKYSFVYTVPFETTDPLETLVTASYAIFPSDAGMEAPGSVVGFQFSHSHLHKRFFEIAKETTCHNCLPCGEYLSCYILDHSGYIVVSESMNQTGIFFGVIEGAVMKTMVEKGIYEEVEMYDFQALCFYRELVHSDATALITPLRYLAWAIEWVVAHMTYLAIKTNLVPVLDAYTISAEDYDTLTTTTPSPTTTRKLRKGQNQEEEDYFAELKTPKYVDLYKACEKQRNLYILQQQLFVKGNMYSGEVPTDCSRPFYIKKIPHSNMLLVAIKTAYPTCDERLTTALTDIRYNEPSEYPCNKLYLNNLTRRRLTGCYNEHPLEHEIKLCGLSSTIQQSLIPISINVILLLKIML